MVEEKEKLSEQASETVQRPHYWRDHRDMIISDAGAEFESSLFDLQCDLDATLAADSKNTFHKNDFASLSITLATVRKACADHGFTLRQFPGQLRGHGPDSKRFYTLPICTKITHKETQQAELIIIDIPVESTAISYGAALTFGKRYALQSYFGLASTDSDSMSFIQSQLEQEGTEKTAENLVEQILETENLEELKAWLKKSEDALKMYSQPVLNIVRKAYAEHYDALKKQEEKPKTNGKAKKQEVEANAS